MSTNELIERLASGLPAPVAGAPAKPSKEQEPIMVENTSGGGHEALAANFIKALRAEAKSLDYEAQKLRRDAAELNIRADTKYNAFIQFDMLADKFEAQQEKLLAERQKGGDA